MPEIKKNISKIRDILRRKEIEDPVIKQALKSLGFTEYISAIYIELLRSGELDARNISERAKVPYSRVYEVLNDMLDRGFINKNPGRPSTFTPFPPKVVFQNLYKQKEKEFMENVEIAKQFLENIYEPKQNLKEIKFQVIENLEDCKSLVQDLLINTNSRADIAIFHEEILSEDILNEIRIQSRRKKEIRFLVLQSIRSALINDKDEEILNIRSIDNPIASESVILIDDIHSLRIVFGKFDSLYRDKSGFIGQYTKGYLKAQIDGEIFNNLWKEAK